MFTELLPLLKQRVVMITVSDVGDGLLRVNVIPRKLDADSDQSQALTTPLSITGSAEELDRELPGQLADLHGVGRQDRIEPGGVENATRRCREGSRS